MIEQIEEIEFICNNIMTYPPKFHDGYMEENPEIFVLMRAIQRNIKQLKQMEEGKWVKENVLLVENMQVNIILPVLIIC